MSCDAAGEASGNSLVAVSTMSSVDASKVVSNAGGSDAVGDPSRSPIVGATDGIGVLAATEDSLGDSKERASPPSVLGVEVAGEGEGEAALDDIDEVDGDDVAVEDAIGARCAWVGAAGDDGVGVEAGLGAASGMLGGGGLSTGALCDLGRNDRFA